MSAQYLKSMLGTSEIPLDGSADKASTPMLWESWDRYPNVAREVYSSFGRAALVLNYRKNC